MLRRAQSVLLLLSLVASPTLAAAVGVELQYAVRYGPLTILEARSTTRLDAQGYETSNEMHTVGVVGMLFPWTATSFTSGSGAGTALVPLTHRAQGEFRGVDRRVAIDYSPGGGVAARVEPPADDDARDPVPFEQQQATVDPLTASLAAIASGCSGTLRVFDGRRRYDMVLADQGQVEVPSSGGIYRGMARHCRATIAPVAGLWRRDTREDERPTQLDSWIAAPRPGLMPVPVYLELSAPRGTLGIDLTDAQALIATAPPATAPPDAPAANGVQ